MTLSAISPSSLILPLLTIAITWVGSVFLFSIQHRKSIQNKWLDSLRDQMAELITTANRITPHSNKDELAAFSKAFLSVQLSLDLENPLHVRLIHKLDDFQAYAFQVTNSTFESAVYTKKCFAVVAVFREIMKEEKKKIRKLL